MPAMNASSQPQPSALSKFLTESNARVPVNALPLEIFHNLQYQHNWTDLQIHSPPTGYIDTPLPVMDLSHIPNPTPTPSRHTPVKVIHGTPPRHIYIHPDFQAHLIMGGIDPEVDVPIQREWVVPMSIGEKWSLRRLSEIFDTLPPRDPLVSANGHKHQDAKRVLLGMLSHNGTGGDGTVVYYIMQEGDVKPRQN